MTSRSGSVSINKFYLFLGLCIFNAHLFARQSLEVINSFESLITVHPDARMDVQETINYTNHGIYGLHGIYRDFPTRYHDRWGNKVVVGFHIQQILRDGYPVPFHLKSMENGKRIYIGDPERIVEPGNYVYTIYYTTTRQLGFFENHDELYWNVTGNGWKFPIKHATAHVTLPHGIPADSIKTEGYTGYQGEQGSDYKTQVTTTGVCLFTTTRALQPGEGLTIVVAWPKGFVTAPTWLTKIRDFVQDNMGILWLLLGLLILLFLYIPKYLSFRAEQRAISGTIIPRFYPPQGLTPSEVMYINRKGFDTKAFAAEIVNMAVHGYLTIAYEETSFLGTSSYTLQAKKMSRQAHEDTETEQEALYATLFKLLFARGETLKLNSSHHTILANAISHLRTYLSNMYSAKCFNFNYSTLAMGVMIAGVFGFIGLFLVPDTSESGFAWLVVIVYALITILFGLTMRGYTAEGMRLNEEIEGFKLFLATTETERLKIIGTPPTRTPELYETYLPYAMALGVEQQWSAQFATLFAQFAQEGHPYVPVWYIGTRPFSAFGAGEFSSQLSSSLSNVIAASATPPGRSSGSGGGGSSGGGGGGGGGGSW